MNVTIRVLTLLAGLLFGRAAQAQQITLFSLPSGSQPSGITLGPDRALWITERLGNRIARLSSAGELTEFPIPTLNSGPTGIVLGSDGNLWFIEATAARIGRLSPTGQFAEFSLAMGGGDIDAITSGPDGQVWVTVQRGFVTSLAKINPAGTVTEYVLPRSSTATGITGGPDGNIWYTRATTQESSIGRITTSGSVTGEWQLSGGSYPWDIETGSDGNLWFVERLANKIGRITPAGSITEFSIPTPNTEPVEIARGPDGHLYFSVLNANKLGRVATNGSITEIPLPAGVVRAGRITAGPGGIWFTVFPGDQVARLSTGNCSSGEGDALCLQNRFRARLTWRRPGGQTSSTATPVPLTQDTGAFWFFSNANLELMVKVVDGRTVNGRFWVFFGSLTNIEFTLTVTDTETGVTRTYGNQPGQLQSLADTAAF